jgi:hypothetical protein
VSERVRRVFLDPREVPQRIVGAIRGDPTSIRRILGGRRSGRIGALLLLGGGMAAFPPEYVWVGLSIHLLLTAVLSRTPRSAPTLGLTARIRLACWTTGPSLILCSALRILWPGGMIPGLVGVIIGQALLFRGLARSFGATPSPPHPDR